MEVTMKSYTRYEFDNRDAAQMYEYLEARIQALKARVGELERENETLRRGSVGVEPHTDRSIRFGAQDGRNESASTSAA
jgi:cell division protein FtsB